MEWWSSAMGGYVGGGIGILGALAGIIGALIGVCAPRAKARRLVISLVVAGILLGVALLITSIVAIFLGQPRHVWYPLLLGGCVLSAVLGGLLPVTLNAYRQAELRKLDAQSLRRS